MSKIKGEYEDWNKFEELKKKFWEGPENNTHCTRHNTYFNQLGDEGEPCWQCYDEARIIE